VVPDDAMDTAGETCGVCGTDLHWSALFCPCRELLTCLQHTTCQCPASRRKLLRRHSLRQLDDMVSALAELAADARVADPTCVFQPCVSYASRLASHGIHRVLVTSYFPTLPAPRRCTGRLEPELEPGACSVLAQTITPGLRGGGGGGRRVGG
jgi:hypothetical protein